MLSILLSLVTGLEAGLWFPPLVGFLIGGVVAVLARRLIVPLVLCLGVGFGWQMGQEWKQMRPPARVLEFRVHNVVERARDSLVRGQVHLSPVRVVVEEAVEVHAIVRIDCVEWEVQEQGTILGVQRPRLFCNRATILEQRPPVWWRAALATAHDRFVAALENTFPLAVSSLFAALSLGDTSQVSQAVIEDFRRSGTSHLLALSGYNVTVMLSLLMAWLPVVVGKRWASWVALGWVGVFIILTGSPPSLVRAGVMAGVVILARHIGRPTSAGNGLIVASLALLLIEPVLIFDLGFLLSVGATGGLVLSGDLQKRRSWTAWWIEPLLTSLSAYLITLPIILPTFGRLSLVAPLANIVIVPLVPPLFFASLGFGVLGMIVPQLGQWLAPGIAWVAVQFLHLVHWFGALPFSNTEVTIPPVLPWLLPLGFAVTLLCQRSRTCRQCIYEPTTVYGRAS